MRLLDIYKERPDLQRAFPDVYNGDVLKLLEWASTAGITIDSAKDYILPYKKEIEMLLFNQGTGKNTISLHSVQNIAEKMKRMITQENFEDIIQGGERVTHLYPNNCYYAHLSIYHFALQFSQNNVVLDAGSGAGYGSAYLADQNAKLVIGIEVSATAVEFSKRNFTRDNLKYQIMDLQNIAGFPNDYFDLIFSSNVLEHVPDVAKFLNAACKLLKPDGTMVLAVPPITSEAARKQDAENPYHLNNWSPKQWHNAFEKFFEDIQPYRHWFDKNDEKEILNFGNTPLQTTIDERDFLFEAVSLEELYSIPTYTAVFVIRKPKKGT